MKLLEDKIIIENRNEIDIFQDMIEQYLKSGKAGEGYKTELEAIKSQLDGLYISW